MKAEGTLRCQDVISRGRTLFKAAGKLAVGMELRFKMGHLSAGMNPHQYDWPDYLTGAPVKRVRFSMVPEWSLTGLPAWICQL